MKQLYPFIVIIILSRAISVFGQTAPIPDSSFLSFLKTNYSSTINSSDQLILSQAAAVTGTFNCSSNNISSLEGIQYFTGITFLYANGNRLTDISQIATMNALKTLHLENNLLTSLPNLDNLTNLQLLIVHTNQLQTLPNLSNNTKLTQIIVYNNLLTTLPNLSTLVNLKKVDAGNNKLTPPPDVSANILLTSLYLDRNFLTQGPDLSNQTNLSLVQLHLNYLTFQDMLPYLSHPNYSAFQLSPQKTFSLIGSDAIANDSLTLASNLDTAITGVTYSWYFNGTLLTSLSHDSLVIFPAAYTNEGNYSCILTHSSFPSIQLNTDTVYIKVIGCPSINNFSFEYQEINCKQDGSLKVTISSIPGQTFTFKLISTLTGDTIISNDGVFDKLDQKEYTLTVESGPCKMSYPNTINIPYAKCKDVFITPNGDGDKDNYFFSASGVVNIYDKNGHIVKSLTIPSEWDGSGNTGSLLPPGYYFVDINKGAESFNITVIY